MKKKSILKSYWLWATILLLAISAFLFVQSGAQEMLGEKTVRGEPTVFDIVLDCEKALKYDTGIYVKYNGTLYRAMHINQLCDKGG